MWLLHLSPVLRSFLHPLSQPRSASVTNFQSDTHIFHFTFCTCCLLQQSSVIFLILSFLISSCHMRLQPTTLYSGTNIEDLAMTVTLKAYLFVLMPFWFRNVALSNFTIVKVPDGTFYHCQPTVGSSLAHYCNCATNQPLCSSIFMFGKLLKSHCSCTNDHFIIQLVQLFYDVDISRMWLIQADWISGINWT